MDGVEKSATARSIEQQHPRDGRANGTVDDALIFIQTHRDDQTATPQGKEYVRGLRRKVDFYVIIFLMLCYMLNFLDKVLLNVGLPAPSHGRTAS